MILKDVECPHTLLEAMENLFLAQGQLHSELKKWFNRNNQVEAWGILRRCCQFTSGWLEHGKMDERDKPRVKKYLDVAEEFLTEHNYLDISRRR